MLKLNTYILEYLGSNSPNITFDEFKELVDLYYDSGYILDSPYIQNLNNHEKKILSNYLEAVEPFLESGGTLEEFYNQLKTIPTKRINNALGWF